MFFRKTRKMSADVQAYFKRNLTPYSGNSARTSAHFSAMFFRKTRKTSADVQAYFKRNLTQYSEKPARTSAHFSVMFFSQDKASKPPLYTHTARRKKRSFTGNSARTSAHFSVMFFRKTRLLSRRRICIPQGARNEVLREKLSPNLSTFFGDVFSQDKENERRRTSVLQAKFDAVLRKNSPKNQISIMSASFFFAISSISLTYLSVIF